jgi:hypothetical protein
MELATILGRQQDAQRLHAMLLEEPRLRSLVWVAQHWPKEKQRSPLPWDEIKAGAGHLRAAALSLEGVDPHLQELISVISPLLTSMRSPIPSATYRESFISELRGWADAMDMILEGRPRRGGPPDRVAEQIAGRLARSYIAFTGRPFQDRATKRDSDEAARFARRAMEMLSLGYTEAQINWAIRKAGQQLRGATPI